MKSDNCQMADSFVLAFRFYHLDFAVASAIHATPRQLHIEHFHYGKIDTYGHLTWRMKGGRWRRSVEEREGGSTEQNEEKSGMGEGLKSMTNRFVRSMHTK